MLFGLTIMEHVPGALDTQRYEVKSTSASTKTETTSTAWYQKGATMKNMLKAHLAQTPTDLHNAKHSTPLESSWVGRVKPGYGSQGIAGLPATASSYLRFRAGRPATVAAVVGTRAGIIGFQVSKPEVRQGAACEGRGRVGGWRRWSCLTRS